MSDFIANDFAAIAQAMKKHELEMPKCPSCGNLGWRWVTITGTSFWSTCDTCANPKNRMRPDAPGPSATILK